ncbi:MAG TPA: Crp/Fnr family transcriptional regulator [Burkholderiales bacterium]|nr:Crp/Fnr family transcriptional regulator [Burkholderiales bacterium]
MPCETWSAETLRTLPLLSSLSDRELAWLQPAIRRRKFDSRACVLNAGDTPDGLYIIVAGRVQLVHQDQEGRALVAETFGPGEIFGEMGLIDSTPCPASMIATQSCELVFIPRQNVLESLELAAIAKSLLRITLERLCKAHRQMANLALTKVYTRVAQVLAASGHEANGEWHVDVGSQQIAAMVGASREMVSRVLRCMIEKRLIRRYKRKLIVIDREALKAAAA